MVFWRLRERERERDVGSSRKILANVRRCRSRGSLIYDWVVYAFFFSRLCVEWRNAWMFLEVVEAATKLDLGVFLGRAVMCVLLYAVVCLIVQQNEDESSSRGPEGRERNGLRSKVVYTILHLISRYRRTEILPTTLCTNAVGCECVRVSSIHGKCLIPLGAGVALWTMPALLFSSP